MKLKTFFSNFELFADAPNGVQKLRELILQLAVKGKLVPQNPSDEPAAVLLEKIKEEKERLIKEGKIKKSKELPPVDVGEMAFDLPQGWEWVRLDNVGDWGAGATPNRRQPEYYGGSILWLKSGELNDSFVDNSKEKITEKALKECSLRKNQPGDILIAMYGATIGKVAILEVEATTNQAVCACTCFEGIYNLYLFILLKAYRLNFTYQGAGAAQPNISRQKIIHTIIPLPPLNEQHRIVAKVDALMKLCDELETRSQNKRDRILKLGEVATTKLTTPSSKESFKQQWKTISDNFDLLYSIPENVKQLRQAILQLAVMGKLVPQNPEDEPATVLLEKIKEEKERLIKEGKIKKSKELPDVDVSEMAFELPDGWEWVRLNEVVLEITSGWSPMCEKRPKESGEWGVLKVSAVSWNKFNPNENKALPSHLKPRPEFETKVGDFLMSRANTSELVCKSVIVEDTLENLLLSDKILKVSFPNFINKRYFNTYNNSLLARDYYSKVASGTSTSMRNISRVQILSLPIPLPPLNEQHRIVTKVNQMMSLCDKLEAKLTQSINDREKLMSAAVRQVLAA